MTPPNHPSKILEGYRLDLKLGAKYRRGSCAGCILVPIFLGLGIYFLAARQNIPVAVIHGVCGIAAFALFVYNQQYKKHWVRCRICKKEMTPQDIPVPKEAIYQKFEGLDKDIPSHSRVTFVTPDGESFMVSRDSETNIVRMYKQYQRWYACHPCKVAFLAEPFVYVDFKEFDDTMEAEQFRLELLKGKDSKIAKDGSSLE